MDWKMLGLCVLAGFGTVFILLMVAMEVTWRIETRKLRRCKLYNGNK